MKLNKILIVDIETTCWEDNKASQQPMELIELGWCEVLLYDNKIKLSNNDGIIVKTSQTLSDYCITLTGITQELVNVGIPFKDAMSKLGEKYSNWTWGSWGEFDRKIIFEQCVKENVDFPLSPRWIDLKPLVHLVIGENKLMGVKECMNYLDMGFFGDQHRAIYDAYNEADLLVEVLCKTRALFQNVLLS